MEPFSNLVLPVRKSALQASQAIADQLDSSDDDSQTGGSDREVKKQKKSPKKAAASRGGRPRTYGKRGRLPKAAGKTDAIPGKSPEAESSPRAPKPKPKKRKRSPSLLIYSSSPMKQIGSSIPVGAEESDMQAKASDIEVSLLYATSPERVLKRAKMSHSGPLEEDRLSDLTSLSPSPKPDSSDSEIEILAFTSAPSESAGYASTQVVSNYGSKPRVEPIWTSQNLGSYVWVLIEPTTARVVDPSKDQGQDECRMWWPGMASDLFILHAMSMYLIVA